VDWPYYSNIGMPQSDQVRYFERFSVSRDGRTLYYSITVDDPVVFTEPFTMERTRTAAPGVEIEPFGCLSDWRDAAAMTDRINGSYTYRRSDDGSGRLRATNGRVANRAKF
ncbi:MAG: hypothetical protein VCC36_12410, partial [Gammaproteobacteria bacterium]